MTNNDELALKLKGAAEIIGSETWHTKGSNVWNDEYEVNGEYSSDLISCCENVNNESVHAEFIATANPANILALLAERDADKKRIEMLEKYVKERDDENQGLLLTVGRLHTKLEARTVSIKLPPVAFFDFRAGSGLSDGAYVNLAAMNKALAAAGIKLEVGE